MTKEVVFAIVDPFFVGDLRKLSLSYHVWVALTPRNKIAHDAACAADSREYSPHYGLSGLDCEEMPFPRCTRYLRRSMFITTRTLQSRLGMRFTSLVLSPANWTPQW